jgi:nickel/cobalt transporter (NicO) family protein
MTRWLIAFALLFGALAALPGASANPFQPGTTRDAAAPSAPPAGGLLSAIAKAQRDMNEAISAKFREMETGNASAALLGILALSFLYGVLHAAGPGHGKSVVASYLLARPKAWPAGIAIGTLSSLLQGAISVLIVVLLALIFQVGGLDLMAHATLVELVSYGLIVGIGLWLFVQAVTGRGCHAHGHHHHDHECAAHGHGKTRDGTTLGLILAAGITPCASAIIVLLFALAQDALVVGIGATLAMSLGMGVTVSAVALLSIVGRRTVTAAVAGNARVGMLVERGLALVGSLLVIGLAGLLLLGAWARL